MQFKTLLKLQRSELKKFINKYQRNGSFDMSQTIAIIPARGGSKGIPRKNIRLLGGKPLIAYTIETALKSKYIDIVVVSTEDEEIAGISKKFGAEVIERPEELAGDESPTIDAIKHVIQTLREKDNYNPDIVVLLQPTTPLRIVEDINNAVELFLNNDCESVVSVCKANPYWCLTIKDKHLEPTFGWDYFYKRRQDLLHSYSLNGVIYITTIENLNKYNSFFNKKIIPYIMPYERSIDIDEEIDFKLAEFFLRREYEESQNKQ
jgi:CMP-N-acetylneuraminic acid synthetase